MSKLKSIIQGWKNDWLYNRGKIPEPIKELFDDRLKVCRSNECGQLIGFVCGACGCPIKKKAKSLTEQCPENFWNPIYYDHDDSPDYFIVMEEVPDKLQPQFKEYLKSFGLDDEWDYKFPTLEHWQAFMKELEKSI